MVPTQQEVCVEAEGMIGISNTARLGHSEFKIQTGHLHKDGNVEWKKIQGSLRYTKSWEEKKNYAE